MPPITIDAERLVLRPFNDNDLDYTADVMRRPDVARYLYWDPMTPDEAAALLKRRLLSLEREGDGLVLAAVLRETGNVIGDVSLRWVSERHRQGDIGFIFHPAAQGKGYASEAAREMLRFGSTGSVFTESRAGATPATPPRPG